jgi:hypothetical protein
MKKFRSFLAGLLLVPVLAFASPSNIDSDPAGLNPPQLTPYCYFYWMGRWVLMPC